MKALPFVMLSVTASLINLDPTLEQASRSLGASAKQTLLFVLLPQVKPGMLAGAIFAFIISWDEVIVVLFITSREVYTLPKRIWDGIFDNVDPAIASIGALMILFTTIALVIGQWLDKRRKVKIGASWFSGVPYQRKEIIVMKTYFHNYYIFIPPQASLS